MLGVILGDQSQAILLALKVWMIVIGTKLIGDTITGLFN